MSTRVTEAEWPDLQEVPRQNWQTSYGGSQLSCCDIQSSHGHATMFWMTPDKRALATCSCCTQRVQLAIRAAAKLKAQAAHG